MKIGPHSKNTAENNTEKPGKLLEICNSLQLLQSDWKKSKVLPGSLTVQSLEQLKSPCSRGW